MNRAAWEVLMVMLERRGQMIPLGHLIGAIPPSKSTRHLRGQLDGALTQLRAVLADTGIEIRRQPAHHLPITHYGLFDTQEEEHGEALRRRA